MMEISLYMINLVVLFPLVYYSKVLSKTQMLFGLAHATGVHERNTVPYARFALKKRHGFCVKAWEKNMQRHRLGTL